MYHDLTKGNISKTLILFALPMIAENLLQQFYNIADTLIVGLSMSSGALFSIYRCVFMGDFRSRICDDFVAVYFGHRNHTLCVDPLQRISSVQRRNEIQPTDFT